MTNKSVRIGCAAAAFALLVGGSVMALGVNHENRLTFSRPVSLPGVVLPAGQLSYATSVRQAANGATFLHGTAWFCKRAGHAEDIFPTRIRNRFGREAGEAGSGSGGGLIPERAAKGRSARSPHGWVHDGPGTTFPPDPLMPFRAARSTHPRIRCTSLRAHRPSAARSHRSRCSRRWSRPSRRRCDRRPRSIRGSATSSRPRG